MIKQIGADLGVEAVMVAAANIIANATKVMDLHLGDIDMDDVWQTVTPLVGWGAKQAKWNLKTSTLKDLVHSFCTVVPLTKLYIAN